jgi:alpha-1,6-mannosyltransferase
VSDDVCSQTTLTVGATCTVHLRFGPTANGDRFTVFQILLATAASTVIAVALIGLTYYRLPWRKLPDADSALVHAPPIVEPSLPAPQPAKPGAYAESP